MIDGWTARLRLLWRQERAELFPVGIGERRESQHLQGSWWIERDRRGLTCTTQPMEALRSRLVLASKARPAQPPGLLFLRLAQRVQQATHLWHAQVDALVGSSPFFSKARACPCTTTRAA